MKSVTVIMSTYNGDKYIKEQLDSIINQKGVSIKLVVRDDGSTDDTLKILEEYKKNYGIKVWCKERNLGPAESFLETLSRVDKKSEFYAYADQDDIWYPEKILRATRKLSEYDDSLPNVYCSTYDVVDKNLNVLYKRNIHHNKKITMEQVIIDRTPSGCTMVFNNKLKELLVGKKPNNLRMHDYWTLLVALSHAGNVYLDDWASMMYRIHDNNTVGLSGKYSFKWFKNLLKSALEGENERLKQAKELYDLYNESMEQDKMCSLERLIYYKKNVKQRFELIINKEYKTIGLSNNFLFIMSVMLGVF